MKSKAPLSIIILTLCLALAPACCAQIATTKSYEATNAKATDPNIGSAPSARTLGASQADAYLSPELPLSPGITNGQITATVTQASSTVSVSCEILYSAAASGCTTAVDQTSGSYTTQLYITGTSPVTLNTPTKLMGGAKAVRYQFVNLSGVAASLTTAKVAN